MNMNDAKIEEKYCPSYDHAMNLLWISYENSVDWFGGLHKYGSSPLSLEGLEWKNPNLKWMMTGGSPILGNLQINSIVVVFSLVFSAGHVLGAVHQVATSHLDTANRV